MYVDDICEQLGRKNSRFTKQFCFTVTALLTDGFPARYGPRSELGVVLS